MDEWVDFTNPLRRRCWSQPNMPAQPWEKGLIQIEIVTYDFVMAAHMRRTLPCYLSKTERFCFKWGPGEFNGMKEARFGQFQYNRAEGRAYMLLDPIHPDRSWEHFHRCVEKARRRRARKGS